MSNKYYAEDGSVHSNIEGMIAANNRYRQLKEQTKQMERQSKLMEEQRREQQREMERQKRERIKDEIEQQRNNTFSYTPSTTSYSSYSTNYSTRDREKDQREYYSTFSKSELDKEFNKLNNELRKTQKEYDRTEKYNQEINRLPSGYARGIRFGLAVFIVAPILFFILVRIFYSFQPDFEIFRPAIITGSLLILYFIILRIETIYFDNKAKKLEELYKPGDIIELEYDLQEIKQDIKIVKELKMEYQKEEKRKERNRKEVEEWKKQQEEKESKRQKDLEDYEPLFIDLE